MPRNYHFRWRIDPGAGEPELWRPQGAPTATAIPFPVRATFEVRADSDTSGPPAVTITVDVKLIDDRPAIVRAVFDAEQGIDLDRTQQEFKWRTTLQIIVGHLTSADPATAFGRWLESDDTRPLVAATALDDDFLERIAREYLEAGRGYSAAFAAKYGISRRSAVRWVEKARARGILSRPATPGAVGGQIIDPADRVPED
ncbi:MAG: hypothetical protein KDC39_01790 [Actinobacteria bacterium]|nr:hypothetical protein [Actinomycetota bacterium]